MDALADLIVKEEKGEKVSEIEECILYYFDESDDSYEKRARIAAAELQRLRAIEAAARELVDRNNFAFNEDQLSTDIDALAAALQKG
jgi:hypothetical protein